MKSIFNKTSLKILCVFGSSLIAFSIQTTAIYASTAWIENEFIKIIVNTSNQDQGRFAIETTGGDPANPNDNNQNLIYGRPIPWTSYTTLRIDNQDHIFGGESKKTSKRTGKIIGYGKPVKQTFSNDRIITEYDYNGIKVGQILTFFRTPSTRVNDSALIEYEISNMTKKESSIGLRLMLDTKLGSNDGAPFRIGSTAIQSEILVPKSDLSQYWQTFDSLTAPSVIAQGTLESPEDGLTPPDKLILANWGSLADDPWTVDYQENRSFIRVGEDEKDTALALYWNPITLNPGQTTRIRTVYGLGGLTLAAGDLSLGLTAPAEATSGSSREILMVAYITNTGGFISHDTVASLETPKGMEIVGGKPTSRIGKLEVGQTRQIPFRIRVKSAQKGTQKITLKVTSSTLSPNQLERSIMVLAPKTATGTLITPPTVDATQAFFNVSVVVKNPYETPLENVVVTIKDTLQPWFEVPTKSIALLPAGRTVTLNWTLKPNPNSTTLTIDSSISSFGLDPENISKTVRVVPVNARLIGTLSHPKLKVGDMGYLSIGGVPNTSTSGNITISGDAATWIRSSADDWAESSIKTNAKRNQIEISEVTVGSKRSGNILKWHFQAKIPGTCIVTIQSDGTTTTIPITITP